MNKILVVKETGFTGVGNGTDGFTLAEAFYFDKKYLIDVGIAGTIPAGLQLVILPNNSMDPLIITSETPATGVQHSFILPITGVSFTVSRISAAPEEGPFTGDYSMVISARGE